MLRQDATPLPTIAQTDQLAAPAASAPGAAAPTGSYGGQMRHRANMSEVKGEGLSPPHAPHAAQTCHDAQDAVT